MENKLVFITGGARSGKSRFAEGAAESVAQTADAQLYYLATSKTEDTEMADRIERHQKDRNASGMIWETIEQPAAIKETVTELSGNTVVLLDCITLLLSNELYKGDFNEQLFKQTTYQKQVKHDIMQGILEIAKHVTQIFVVSNEVLYDPVDVQNEVVYVYQRLLGEIHQELVEYADEVYLVEAGIPLQKK